MTHRLYHRYIHRRYISNNATIFHGSHMNIALAQINPTIGDIDGNADKIRDAIEQAKQQDAELVVFPELSIIGYPPKDLLLTNDMIAQCAAAVEQIATSCIGIGAIIGYPWAADIPRGLPLHNGAAFCTNGRIAHRHIKSLLPTYDVFDEQRYFEPGRDTALPYAFNGIRFGLTICEDLWNNQNLLSHQLYHHDPVASLAEAGAQVLVNCSASPFVVDKHRLRLELASAAARQHHVPVIYCNQVGGNDELVFDGNSFAIDADGQLVAHANDFQTDLLLFKLETDSPCSATAGQRRPGRIDTPKEGIESTYHALVLGLRDYCDKCGFASIVVGLSGGIDSAVTCALCVDAIGAAAVRGVSMPSRYSSDSSKRDALALAENLGVELQTIPIDRTHTALDQTVAPHLNGPATDVTAQNIQARIRGAILMALSNQFGSLLVTTGNKSELAVGYCTLYGDMCGGMAVLSDVPKTMVCQLAQWINQAPNSPLRCTIKGPVIPTNSLTKPPSAELCPDQTDQDTLPPYDVLDQIIERYVERGQPTRQIIKQTGFDTEMVLRIVHLIERNEYKRQQAAPGLKITSRAFGFGRRMPIAHRYDSRQIPALGKV